MSDLLADFDREKFELQKQQTQSIEELMNDTNLRLARMENEYRRQMETTVRYNDHFYSVQSECYYNCFISAIKSLFSLSPWMEIRKQQFCSLLFSSSLFFFYISSVPPLCFLLKQFHIFVFFSSPNLNICVFLTPSVIRHKGIGRSRSSVVGGS